MIDRNSLSIEEWGDVISVPASIGALVVTADPSGPMGLIKEFRAIMDSIKSYVDAHSASSPLMGAIHTYLTTKPTEEEEADLKRWAEDQQNEMKANKPQTPEEMKDLVHARTTEVLATLRAKGATEEDLSLFKTMIYTVAEGVANASKEGTFLGFGGTRVSDAEKSVLAQIKAELGV